MRLFVNTNNLPPECDIDGLECLNMHWHANEWPREQSADYTITAFSNGVNPFAFPDGPFCLDLEPEALWRTQNAAFDKWRAIHSAAITSVREVFPKRELLAYDPCGGASFDAAMRNVNACRRMLLSLDGAGVSTYANDDGSFSSPGEAADVTIDAYQEMRNQSRRLDWQIGTVVTNRTRSGDYTISRKVFRQSIQFGIDRGVDFILLWQAEVFFGGAKGAAKRLQPFIDIIREFGQ